MTSKKEIMTYLKQEILSLALKPGDIISETVLSERFQLSRTPIRDVLKQLSLEHYVDIYPKKGNLVSYIDLESVEQIIYLRNVLEKEIMKSLAGNIPLKGLHGLRENLQQQQKCIEQAEGAESFLLLDDQFHRMMFGLAGREFLWGVLQQFNVHYIRYRKLHMLKDEKLTTIQQEHQQLLDYIMQGDTAGIDKLLHHHLRADIDSMNFQEHFAGYIKK
ncbi:GntR family transcriptional regulator [Paenibacillus sp. MMS20-IR301]|uniref:GntR family transcriptional regulator n=1 Tax=Paenibacillus sp. MMS20-IR301 TaxID=2895946 RepID=UPI0028EB5624|nr:GntR family transcriptional regulator [Paenibacillus sp. MMS20-IR301]WNS44189.1 GntR family transcriptional regulator [Paenibacillus sp. MMS20-IR301]